ncbi:MAG: PIN domain-containing protein [Bacteroidota bacterium]
MSSYIIDANLIFSSLLNLGSGIAQFILNHDEFDVMLFAPERLKFEIENHHDKIVKISRLSTEEVKYARDKLYSCINFIDDQIIPFEEYVKAMRIIRDVDPADVHFVALANYMDEKLWTGDVKLYEGLKSKGYEKVINFSELKIIFSL